MSPRAMSPMTCKPDTASIWFDEAYLRAQAERCVRLARICPDQATAHELESLATDLMAKAAEVQALHQFAEADSDAPSPEQA